jgi:RNA polymerase sigma-B factor
VRARSVSSSGRTSVAGNAGKREVLLNRFFPGLTQHEIGERLGISQMHISRLLRGALEKMRAGLTDEDP